MRSCSTTACFHQLRGLSTCDAALLTMVPICERSCGMVALMSLGLSESLTSWMCTHTWRRVAPATRLHPEGHTYFAALFSLSAYKQFFLSGVGKFWSRVVGFICVCCMVTEVSLVAAARFHYTVDMLVAVVLVGLLFDSTYVEQIAADWSEGFRPACAIEGVRRRNRSHQSCDGGSLGEAENRLNHSVTRKSPKRCSQFPKDTPGNPGGPRSCPRVTEQFATNSLPRPVAPGAAFWPHIDQN